MESKALVKTLSRELVSPTLDVAQDYAELGLEELLDSPIVEHVPVIKTAIALYKTGLAIRERYFAKKLLVFLKEFHSGETQNSDAQEFRVRLDRDESFRDRVVEHLLVMIDRFVGVEKSNVLGLLFRAHVNGAFDWDAFVGASMSLDMLQPDGFKVLHALAPFKGKEPTPDMEALLLGAGIASRYGTAFRVSPVGQLLYQYGIGPYFAARIKARDKMD